MIHPITQSFLSPANFQPNSPSQCSSITLVLSLAPVMSKKARFLVQIVKVYSINVPPFVLCNAFGVVLSRGSLGPCCTACAAGKAKQNAVPKCSTHVPSTENNGRMFLDIVPIKRIKDGPLVAKPNWCIVVEERTNLKFSSFYKTKGGTVEPTCEQLH
jgi:hypothetical protein